MDKQPLQIKQKPVSNLNCMARDAKYAPTKIETSVNPDSVGMISVSDDLISVFWVSKLIFYLQVLCVQFFRSSTEMVSHRGL